MICIIVQHRNFNLAWTCEIMMRYRITCMSQNKPQAHPFSSANMYNGIFEKVVAGDGTIPVVEYKGALPGPGSTRKVLAWVSFSSIVKENWTITGIPIRPDLCPVYSSEGCQPKEFTFKKEDTTRYLSVTLLVVSEEPAEYRLAAAKEAKRIAELRAKSNRLLAKHQYARYRLERHKRQYRQSRAVG